MKKLALLFVIISFLGCKTEQKMPENFDYGTMENGVYTNDFFKFRMPYDDTWNIQSLEQMNRTAQQGADMVINEDVKAAIEAAEVKTANLFAAYRYPLENPVEYNYSIIVLAENTNMFPQVKRGSDYLDEAKKLMGQTVVDYEFPDAYTTTNIGNKSFDVMSVTGNYMGGQFKQEYMTTLLNGFSFSIILSYESNEQKQVLQNVVDQMTFNATKTKKKS